jgi:hypothetical protein
MHVIWHDHISTDFEPSRLTPGITQDRVHVLVSQHSLPPTGAHRHEMNDRSIVAFAGWQMHRPRAIG